MAITNKTKKHDLNKSRTELKQDKQKSKQEPKCRFFGKCGGCSNQHVPYELQLENKLIKLKTAINYSNIKVYFDNPFHYRNRMDFIFHKHGMGLRKKGKWWDIVDIDYCSIANEKLNAILQEVRQFFKDCDYFDLKKKTGTFMYAVIRTPSNDSSVSFVLNKDSLRLNNAIEKVKGFAKQTTANNIIITYVHSQSNVSISEDYFVVKGSDVLKESYLGKEFHYNVQGFFQNNTIMAEKMHQYVHDILTSYNSGNAYLLDLYGGVGTFGVINSELFKHVTIVESFPGCIDSAKENLMINNVSNAEAILLDAKNLKKLSFPKPLYVITDPPRSGMHPNTIKQLTELKPEVIIYVSCNVNQLAKEIKHFKEYEIKSAALFDLFPQTNHMESVVELVRKN